jgi:hypothetical protein
VHIGRPFDHDVGLALPAPNSDKNQTQRGQAISGVKPVVVMARRLSSGTVVRRAGYSGDPDACTLADWKLIKWISSRK